MRLTHGNYFDGTIALSKYLQGSCPAHLRSNAPALETLTSGSPLGRGGAVSADEVDGLQGPDEDLGGVGEAGAGPGACGSR